LHLSWQFYVIAGVKASRASAEWAAKFEILENLSFRLTICRLVFSLTARGGKGTTLDGLRQPLRLFTCLSKRQG
jgi:hypothetical protein